MIISYDDFDPNGNGTTEGTGPLMDAFAHRTVGGALPDPPGRPGGFAAERSTPDTTCLGLA